MLEMSMGLSNTKERKDKNTTPGIFIMCGKEIFLL
jgi:hypothetical protein